jgi:hypothetical protein
MQLTASAGSIACQVRRIQFLGSFLRYVAAIPGIAREVTVETTRAVAGITEGSAAFLDFDGAEAILFTKR